ncbi:serine hydrolase domain-containing protein [Sediminitomix flava]|uniref:CubicO group peptidase (Beta-lactamase class C family) n=1 Tax=Sediminitomix flava TaxID=379075 RepID=A0A315ZBU5_SEDFL|nr:serine hydrolase domain-containing protein [Sediminitomix flava]PWJ43011.1 CubicO group peptidase (beta-lactamase class C family) [Sediminitomix flava]
MKNWILFLCIISTHVSFGQKIDATYVNNYFDSLNKINKFSGQVLIAKGENILYKNSFGEANYSSHQSFNDSTRFQIASLSKQFTASAILLLQERELLNIDSAFVNYFPEFPFKGITIRQMLNHTSGLPEFFPKMTNDMNTTIVNGNQKMIEMLQSKKYKLEFEPGTQWQYCNISYCLLASLIENLSGKSYDTFMKENLFLPAQMYHTTAELTTDIRTIKGDNLALGYVYDKTTKKFIRAEELPQFNLVYWLGGFYGDGSVISTASDLLKWSQALKNTYPLSQNIVEQLTEIQYLKSGEKANAWGNHYGLGWSILNSQIGLEGKIIEHSGEQPGFRARLTIALEHDLTIVILSNLEIERFWELQILSKAISSPQ